MADSRGRLAPAPFFWFCALSPPAARSPPPNDSSISEDQIQWEPIDAVVGHVAISKLDSFHERQRRIADRVGSETPWRAADAPGTLKIVVHSAISGRPLAAAVVDQRGEGKGTAYFSEEPRVFFLEVNVRRA